MPTVTRAAERGTIAQLRKKVAHLKPDDLLQDGRYRIVAYIDSGGFGTVYKAVDTRFDSIVAIKANTPRLPSTHTATEEDRLRQFLEQARRRFDDEAKLLHVLRHRNLPRVTDYFDEPSWGQFMVMDYIEGISLDMLLEQRGAPLPEIEALYYIREVADALKYLHNHQPPIVHRDVKPANIILTKDNGVDRVFLVDFGIAKTYFDDNSISMQARGISGGYSPPEQYHTHLPTTTRADIYALGATLYTLLTYTSRNEDRLHDAPSRSANPDDTVPLREKNPAISEATSDAVMWAISLAVKDRPPSVAHFLERLPGLTLNSADNATDITAVHWPETKESTHRPNRHRLSIAAGILLLGLVIWLLIAFLPTGAGMATPAPLNTDLPATDIPTTAIAVAASTTNGGTTEAPLVTIRETVSISATNPSANTRPADPLLLAPTLTPTAGRQSASPSPSPSRSVGASVEVNTNVYTRLGPGLEYDIGGSLTAGQIATVIARDALGFWYLVQPERGEPTWVWASFVTFVSGSSENLRPAATIPPLPTTTPTLVPTATNPPAENNEGPGGNPPRPVTPDTPTPRPTNTLAP